MTLKSLFQRSKISLLERTLDAAALRQRANASNIANISTPGYQRKEVVFESELRRALDTHQVNIETTHPAHLTTTPSTTDENVPKITLDQSQELSSGLNNVDIDKEMAELAKNQIHYTVTAHLLSRRFQGLKEAIKGRS